MISVLRIEIVRPDRGKNQILLSFTMGNADKDRSAASGKRKWVKIVPEPHRNVKSLYEF